EEAELVALGVGEHDPRHLVALADVDLAGAEGEQALELLGLVAPRRVDVDVDAVLRHLRFGYGYEDEQRLRRDGLAGGRQPAEPALVVDDRPRQHLAPEPGEGRGL